MKKYFTFLIFIIFWSCDNNTPTEPNDNEDSPLVLDTVRFSNLTNLFKDQCYQCHSEEGFSFYGLNLDTYGNVMSGSINGPVVIPFEPYQSLLYIKCTPEFLQNSDLSTGGERMPKENESFFDDNPEKLQLIHDWIKDGCIE
tara:strand:+ start:216 stop:641 length:426 start_codon:yes stop_codon:yes gene_type:complete